MRKTVVLSIFFVLLFPTYAFADTWHNLPDGICAKYAAQEFEKNPTLPGTTWLNYNYDWVIQANKAGLVVRTTVRDAMVGAIIEWQDFKRYSGHVAIVRQILSDKIIVEETNVGKKIGYLTYKFDGIYYKTDVTTGWGKTTIRSIKYSDLLKMNTEKFIGYIWPIRKNDYAKDPSKYKISIVDQMHLKEPLYKGFREYWQFTYLLKEFDKIAPSPGVNWHGNVNDWINNAHKAGWETTMTNPCIGALIIRGNPSNKFVKVGIVRSIDANTIRIDSRKDNLYPFSEELLLNRLSTIDKDGYTLLGYILPIRLQGDSNL